MKRYKVEPISKLQGTITLPGDKSISHRAVMVGSIAQGSTRIRNFANSQDCLRTVEAFRHMGIDITAAGNELTVTGKGLRGLKKPESALYLGNSGTTMRLILGILAGQSFECELAGDESLSRRPMGRVTHPLRMMGARIEGRGDAEFAPLAIKGGKLKAISYETPVPSAQVKSSILFAGLYADGTTAVKEKAKSRDHTERMLKLFGADLKVDGLSVSVNAPALLEAREIEVPADLSSASFFAVAAALLKGSSVIIKKVLYNPTRTGIIEVLKKMGADIKISNEDKKAFEPVCDITVKSGALKAIEIGPDIMPSVIDEIPIIMVAAALARGRTVIRGAGELRVKETDRISSMTTNLMRMKANVEVEGDNIVIEGAEKLHGAELESFGDHRTAMSMIMAALTAEGNSTISDVGCVDTSFPGFFDTLKMLTGKKK